MSHHTVPAQMRNNAQRMRKVMTMAELKLWNKLRAHRLMGLSFRRQMPIDRYIVDFACPEHKLIIEVDGATHSFDEQIAYDHLRTSRLTELGWLVYRVSNDSVLNNISEVCDGIIRMIGLDKFN